MYNAGVSSASNWGSLRHDKRCLFCSDRCDSFGHRHVFISREQLASQQLDLCEFLYATQGSRPYHSDQHSQLYLRPQLASHDRCLGRKPLSSLRELQWDLPETSPNCAKKQTIPSHPPGMLSQSWQGERVPQPFTSEDHQVLFDACIEVPNCNDSCEHLLKPPMFDSSCRRSWDAKTL